MNERFFDIWHKYVIGNIEDFRIGLTQLEKEIRSDERRKFADLLPQAFCQYCNQEACEGGMVGSVQECETIRMLKDVIDEVVDEKTSVSEKEQEQERRWIPVTERLPEEGERVLATHLGGLDPHIQVIEHTFECGHFVRNWYMDRDITSPTFGQRYMGDVIAWMPMPEPYEAELKNPEQAYGEAINNWIDELLSKFGGQDNFIRMLTESAKEVVDEKKSDREERKIVGWISHIECGIHGNMQYWVCSKCKELFSHDAETGIEITDYRFCPNCGAEMKGVVE